MSCCQTSFLFYHFTSTLIRFRSLSALDVPTMMSYLPAPLSWHYSEHPSPQKLHAENLFLRSSSRLPSAQHAQIRAMFSAVLQHLPCCAYIPARFLLRHDGLCCQPSPLSCRLRRHKTARLQQCRIA